MSDQEKIEKFDVVICDAASREVYAVLAATIETCQGKALQSRCEARFVTPGRFKVGDKLPTK